MKTSNKLIIIATLWLLTFMVYEKYLVKQEYLKIDHKEQFGEFDYKDTLQFKHLVVSGGNNAIIRLGKNRKRFPGIHCRSSFRKYLKYNVANDTLYINMSKEITGLNVQVDSYKKLIVDYDELESITAEESNINLMGSGLKELKIKLKSHCGMFAFVKNMGNMDIDVSDFSHLRFSSKKTIAIDSLKLSVNEKSFIDIEKVEYKHLDTILVSENSKLILLKE